MPQILRWLRGAGFDAAAIARAVGLDPRAVGYEEVEITHEGFDALLAESARATGDPILAVHLPGRLAEGRYNLGELAARSSPTLREAFERVVRYAPLFYAHLSFRCADHDGGFVVEQRTTAATPPGRYGNEYGLAATLHHARLMGTSALAPRAVRFAHAEVTRRERVLLGEHFGTGDLMFRAASNALVFDLADVDRRSVTDDPRLLATAVPLADELLSRTAPRGDFVALVEEKVRAGLETREVEATDVARRLRLATRTLQRRLEERGTTFREVVERVRRDVALCRLRDPDRTLEDVAASAGFTDVAAFARAFKRWTGAPPGQYRRAHSLLQK